MIRSEPPAYLAGLMLNGRDVLVVGGGRVAERRVPRLLEAEARVRLVSPKATPALAALAARGDLVWLARPFAPTDIAGAWYVLALSDVPAVNAEVAAAAEAVHTFCVRADDAAGGTARTPATGTAGGVRLGVLCGDPHVSARARDVALAALDRCEA